MKLQCPYCPKRWTPKRPGVLPTTCPRCRKVFAPHAPWSTSKPVIVVEE